MEAMRKGEELQWRELKKTQGECVKIFMAQNGTEHNILLRDGHALKNNDENIHSAFSYVTACSIGCFMNVDELFKQCNARCTRSGGIGEVGWGGMKADACYLTDVGLSAHLKPSDMSRDLGRHCLFSDVF